nr:hypothetical protein GCM10020093_012030 [Planobispora longispora]
MHGGLGSARQAERSYGWNAEADRRGFAVAYPDGYGRAWNVGDGCCGRPGRERVDDVAFIGRMVTEIRRELSVDPARVYATGISNGGMMAYRLACDSTVFAAIGPVAATRLGGCPAPKPLSVIHVHGLADRMVRFDGAPGTGIARIDGPPVRAVLAGWRATDRCGRPAVSRSGAVTAERARCRHGRAVELITIEGAGHQWPGGEVVRERADPRTRASTPPPSSGVSSPRTPSADPRASPGRLCAWAEGQPGHPARVPVRLDQVQCGARLAVGEQLAAGTGDDRVEQQPDLVDLACGEQVAHEVALPYMSRSPSPARLRAATWSTTSPSAPSRISVPSQVGSRNVVEATYLGIVFILSANPIGSSRDGQASAKPS